MPNQQILVNNNAMRLTELFQARVGMRNRLNTVMGGILDVVDFLIDDERKGFTLCTYKNQNMNKFTMMEMLTAIAEERVILAAEQQWQVMLDDDQVRGLDRIHRYMINNQILGTSSTPGDAFGVAVEFVNRLHEKMKREKSELGTHNPREGLVGRIFADINFG